MKQAKEVTREIEMYKQQITNENPSTDAMAAGSKDLKASSSSAPYTDEVVSAYVDNIVKSNESNHRKVNYLSLQFAILHGRWHEAQQLIAELSDFDSQDFSGETALCYAVQEDHPQLVKLLLQRGADVEHRNWKGQTPIFKIRSEEVADILISHHASIDALDRNNRSLMHELIENRLSNHLALHLLRHSPNLNVQESLEGNTPLHLAIQKQDLQLVDAMLQKNPQLGLKNTSQKTPLLLAHDMDKRFQNRETLAIVVKLASKRREIDEQQRFSGCRGLFSCLQGKQEDRAKQHASKSKESHRTI